MWDYHHNKEKIQFDLFIPELSMAIEYNGEHHFKDIFAFGPQYIHFEKDVEKREACAKANITLIEVPYWWDFKKESLMSTIQQIRPEILNEVVTAQPIPLQKPTTEKTLKKKEKKI